MAEPTLDQLLSEADRAYVAQRVRDGAYASVGDFLSDLIRRDREQQAARRLRELIEEGLASGPATPFTDADWEALRERVLAAGR